MVRLKIIFVSVKLYIKKINPNHLNPKIIRIVAAQGIFMK